MASEQPGIRRAPDVPALTIAMLGPAEPFRGGIVHYTALLREELERRHRVSFFRFSRHYPRMLYPGEVNPEAVTASQNDGAAALDWMNPISWESVARGIIDAAPDIVIVPWWTTFWSLPYSWILRRVRARMKVRVLFICHNVLPHEHTALGRLATTLSLRAGTDFFVHSDDEAETLRGLVRAADPRVVPHPSYARFNTGRFDRATARERLGIEPEREVLLFFGYVRPYKGLAVLLRAMAEAALSVRGVTLFVVGEFWEDRQAHERTIAALGLGERVRIVDRYVPEDEMELYFAACDVAVLPYTSVTGSGAAQLAAGFRRPIVASALGDLTSVVRDGVNGYLVPPSDPAALAGAIARALDARETLQRNVDTADEQRPWSRYVDEVERLVDGR
ncbi:MAG: glycosyltransferase [Gemmatimonadaceae bacterium]